MDFERAMETQRLKLLRILTGLALVVVFVARIPAVSMMPRWVCAAVLAQLVRIESAINSLIIVASVAVCGYRGEALRLPSPAHLDRSGRDVPIAGLLRKIARLQAILDDLPGHARRLMRRMTRSNTAEPEVILPVKHDGGLLQVVSPFYRRIERPPIPSTLSIAMN